MLEGFKESANSREKEFKNQFPTHSFTSGAMATAYGISIDCLKSLLPTEKEHEKQIAQEAWAACLDYVTTPGLPDFEQYFTNTYGE